MDPDEANAPIFSDDCLEVGCSDRGECSTHTFGEPFTDEVDPRVVRGTEFRACLGAAKRVKDRVTGRVASVCVTMLVVRLHT
jgi:hypothetical protein